MDKGTIFATITVTAFIGLWIWFSVLMGRKGASKVIRFAGGFVAACVGLMVLAAPIAFYQQISSNDEGSGSNASETKLPIARSTARSSPTIVGTWYCRNSDNYIHKQEYLSDGSYRTYQTSWGRGVRSDKMPLNSTGTYRFDGDILRISTRSVSGSGSESSNTLKITELTDESLVRYWQGMNRYERCYKPID